MGIGQSGQHGTNVVILVEVESNTGKEIARIHNQCMVGRLVVEILPTLIYVASKHAQVCFTWDILSAWFYIKYVNYLSLMYLFVLVVSYQVGVLIYFFILMLYTMFNVQWTSYIMLLPGTIFEPIKLVYPGNCLLKSLYQTRKVNANVYMC